MSLRYRPIVSNHPSHLCRFFLGNLSEFYQNNISGSSWPLWLTIFLDSQSITKPTPHTMIDTNCISSETIHFHLLSKPRIGVFASHAVVMIRCMCICCSHHQIPANTKLTFFSASSSAPSGVPSPVWGDHFGPRQRTRLVLHVIGSVRTYQYIADVLVYHFEHPIHSPN